MSPANFEAWRARLRRRLAVVVGDHANHVRLSAIRAVKAMLADDDPLTMEPAESLLARVVPPWAKREYRGCRVPMTVRRPPESILDVWD